MQSWIENRLLVYISHPVTKQKLPVTNGRRSAFKFIFSMQ